MNKQTLFTQAMNIAETYDVSSPKDGAVLFSISFLPTKQNKIDAINYTKNHPNTIILDNTPCGKALIDMGTEQAGNGLSKQEVLIIWQTASKRFVEHASGNLTAFTVGADKRGLFHTVELPTALTNPNITTINNIDKFKFTDQ